MIVDPRIAHDPTMSKMSLSTPARVRTRPEAAPMSQTEERLREKVRQALRRSIGGQSSLLLTRGRR